MNKTDKFQVDFGKLSSSRDEIYGFSIIWIMLFHSYLVEIRYFKGVPVLEYIGRFIDCGNMGVEVFLFLSGICLYFSFCKNSDPTAFMRKRLVRIFPSFLLIYGPFCILQYMSGKMSLLTSIFQLTTLRFWFTPARANWFISLILACYLFYPYIFGILYKKEEGLLVRTVVLVLLVVLVTWMIKLEAPVEYKNIEIALTRFPVFIIGCAFGKTVYDKKTFPSWMWILILGALVLCMLVLKMDILKDIWRRYFYMVGGIPMTILLAHLLPLSGEIFCRILRFFGSISLELYITHLVMKNVYQQGWLFPYVPGSITRWMAVLFIAVLLSWLVSKVVSLPGRLLTKGH